jgi:hypothetical protein
MGRPHFRRRENREGLHGDETGKWRARKNEDRERRRSQVIEHDGNAHAAPAR